MKKTVLGVIRAQWTRVPPVARADLTGQTVVITGANTGLGFEAAVHFARMNPARLVLACRNQAKADAALERIRKETGCTTAEVWLVDQADFSSVVAFADRAEREGMRIDIFVANAGLLGYDYIGTKDGYETMLQVNHLATSLLTLLLVPRLQETGKKYGVKPRIVVVSSGMHYWCSVDDKVLESGNIFIALSTEEQSLKDMETRYSQTKLLNVFFVRSLSALLRDTPIITTAVCPGYCYSDIRKSFTGLRAVIDRLMELFLAWPTEEGARQLVYGAVGVLRDGDVDALRGAYLDHTVITEPSDFVLGEEGKRREDILWDELIRELSKVDPRVQTVVRELR